jgi:hypothetical protein
MGIYKTKDILNMARKVYGNAINGMPTPKNVYEYYAMDDTNHSLGVFQTYMPVAMPYRIIEIYL